MSHDRSPDHTQFGYKSMLKVPNNISTHLEEVAIYTRSGFG